MQDIHQDLVGYGLTKNREYSKEQGPFQETKKG